MNDDGSYTSADVASAAAITYRQLDSWRTSGLVRPRHKTSGSGVPTRWTREELAYVVALADLRRAGVSLESLRADPTPKGVRALCAKVLDAIEDAQRTLPNTGRVSSRRQVPPA